MAKFLSDTNVILVRENGKKLPRSVYINKLKRCKIKHHNKPEQDKNNDTSDSDNNNIYFKSNIQCIYRYEFSGLIMINTIITVDTHCRNRNIIHII